VARAKQLTLRGEREGWLYVDAALSPGTKVVAQGRALLADGDRIQASPEPAAPSAPSGSASARGGKGAPL